MACEKHGYTNNTYCPACDLETIERESTPPAAVELPPKPYVDWGCNLAADRLAILAEDYDALRAAAEALRARLVEVERENERHQFSAQRSHAELGALCAVIKTNTEPPYSLGDNSMFAAKKYLDTYKRTDDLERQLADERKRREAAEAALKHSTENCPQCGGDGVVQTGVITLGVSPVEPCLLCAVQRNALKGTS